MDRLNRKQEFNKTLALSDITMISHPMLARKRLR